MIDYPLFHNPVEITNALVTVASQENCDGPEYDLMMEAADYIRLLESLLDLSQSMTNDYATQARQREYPHGIESKCIDEWINKNKGLSPDFVKIVENNFWELLV